jgi:hypothetical protein
MHTTGLAVAAGAQVRVAGDSRTGRARRESGEVALPVIRCSSEE